MVATVSGAGLGAATGAVSDVRVGQQGWSRSEAAQGEQGRLARLDGDQLVEDLCLALVALLEAPPVSVGRQAAALACSAGVHRAE